MNSSVRIKTMIDVLEMSYKYSNVDGGNTLVPQALVFDILEYLKAQEPVVPIRFYNDENKCRDHYRCPYCDDDLTYGQKYCAECGRLVKWE